MAIFLWQDTRERCCRTRREAVVITRRTQSPALRGLAFPLFQTSVACCAGRPTFGTSVGELPRMRLLASSHTAPVRLTLGPRLRRHRFALPSAPTPPGLRALAPPRKGRAMPMTKTHEYSSQYPLHTQLGASYFIRGYSRIRIGRFASYMCSMRLLYSLTTAYRTRR